MNLDELKFLLNKYQLTANKLRGQNFLISDEVLDHIMATAEVGESELVLEVGPGLGALTTRLTAAAGQVVAFEVDKNLATPLAKLAGASSNLEIIWQDILSLDDRAWQAIMDKYQYKDYKIVANIPYYLTAKFINKFLTSNCPPQTMTLLVQQEVAERIVDPKKHSLLSLAVALYGRGHLVSKVGRNNFYPAPQVDSAILHISDITGWNHQLVEKKVWQIIKRGFSAKRKKLINNLSTDPSFSKDKLKQVMIDLDIDLGVRAEALEPKDWLNLAGKLGL